MQRLQWIMLIVSFSGVHLLFIDPIHDNKFYVVCIYMHRLSCHIIKLLSMVYLVYLYTELNCRLYYFFITSCNVKKLMQIIFNVTYLNHIFNFILNTMHIIKGLWLIDVNVINRLISYFSSDIVIFIVIEYVPLSLF